MRNATPSLLELNVAFSWLVEKQAIYHSRPPLDSFGFGNKFVSFTDKLVFRARDFVRVAPFVGKKFPAPPRLAPGEFFQVRNGADARIDLEYDRPASHGELSFPGLRRRRQRFPRRQIPARESVAIEMP